MTTSSASATSFPSTATRYKALPKLIAQTLEVHAGAGRVIEGVASTLRNLCRGGGAPGGGGVPGSSLLNGGSIETLVWLLRTHNDSTIVALSLVGALRYLAADMSRGKEMLNIEAREALKACMLSHLDDNEIKAEVTETLRRLEDCEGGVETRQSRQSTGGGKMRGAIGGSKAKKTPGMLSGRLVSKMFAGGSRKTSTGK